MDSLFVVMSDNSGIVKSLTRAWGILVNNTPTGNISGFGLRPVFIELSKLEVIGNEQAIGISLTFAGGSFIEGNELLVLTEGDGTGIEVINSPRTTIQPLDDPDRGLFVDNSIHVGHGFITELPGLAEVGTLELGGFFTGVGLAIDLSPWTVLFEGLFVVSEPVEGIGLLVLDSREVKVDRTTVDVLAERIAHGVLVDTSPEVQVELVALSLSSQGGIAILQPWGDQTLVTVNVGPPADPAVEPQPVWVRNSTCEFPGTIDPAIHHIVDGHSEMLIDELLTHLRDGNHIVHGQKSNTDNLNIFCGLIPTESDWFSLSNSNIAAEADHLARGVRIDNSDNALIGGMYGAGGSIIEGGNNIAAHAHPLEGADVAWDFRFGGGVSLTNSADSHVISNDISARAQILGDGLPTFAGTAGISARWVRNLQVRDNKVSADSGDELVLGGEIFALSSGDLDDLLLDPLASYCAMLLVPS